MMEIFGIIKAILFGILFFALLIGLMQLMGYPAITTLIGIFQFFVNNFLLVQIFFVLMLAAGAYHLFSRSMNEFENTFKHHK